MFVSILALHGYEPDLITQHPTVLQVIQDWACRVRNPDPHGCIDAMAAKLLANAPMPTYSFTELHVVRISAIMIAALGAVQAAATTQAACPAPRAAQRR